jgi:hypothetical protein
MLRVRARYADERGQITGVPQLNWPPACACCGLPTEARLAVTHRARESAGGWFSPDGITSYKVAATGHDMGWQVPCCEACQAHSRKSRNPFRLRTMLVFPAVATMFAGGFALFSMGIADDPDASAGEIAIAIAFVVANFYAWWGIWRLLGAFMRQRGRASISARCADSVPPVSATSGSQFVRFDFTNDSYAAAVAQANNLMAERVPFVFPIVGDMLVRVQA